MNGECSCGSRESRNWEVTYEYCPLKITYFKGGRGREHGCIGIGLGRKDIFGCGALWVSIPT